MEAKVFRIYLVAGEPSGDLIGAGLMQACHDQADYPIQFDGIGGLRMKEHGLTSLFPMTDLSIMGLIEILPRIPHILKRLHQTIDHIKKIQPDVIVTLDAPSFNFRLVKRLQNLDTPLVHYTAPTVWAWRPGRAKKIAKIYDHLLTLFSFEPPYFEKHGLPTTFVGHPLVEKNIDQVDPTLFRQQHSLNHDVPIVCLLPGSRFGELTKLLPVFAQTMHALLKKMPDLKIVIPTLAHLQSRVQQFFQNYGLSPIIVIHDNEKYQAMRAVSVALAASGTITLELALARTPMVVAYKVHTLTAWILKFLIKTSWVALPNILLKKPIVGEYIQDDCNPEKLSDALYDILNNPSIREQQCMNLQYVTEYLSKNHESPNQRAAKVILSYRQK